MESGRIDRLLSDRGEENGAALPPGFAPKVLRQAQAVKAALIRHRRWLMISSVIAMGLAVLLSSRMGTRNELAPPPFETFQIPAFAPPNSRP